VDPAARTLNAAFDRIVLRSRLLAAAEAAAWAAAVASASWIAGALGLLAGVAWTSKRAARAAVIRRLDRAASGSNVLVTADEVLRDALHVSASSRERVLDDASRQLGAIAAARAAPIAPVWRAVSVAALCWTVVAVMSTTRERMGHASAPGSTTPVPAAASGSLHVSADIDPPAYTGLPHFSLEDPSELRLVEGSRVRLRAAVPVTITRDGAPTSPEFLVQKNGYAAVTSSSVSRRLIPIIVTPDALPTVRVTAPARDLVFADVSARIAIEVRASDDFGLRSLALQYTKVSGSGEEYSFDAGEIPLAIVRRNTREWSGSVTRTVSSLGLKDGDMLVYRAVAADTKPGERQAVSDAFFVEMSTHGIAAGDAFTLPEEETRYALSEQMLILKTDRLARRSASMATSEFTDASLNLAVEQRTIRAEFVFMLGGEISDEEVEAERSIELQAGRLANRGQRDLRDATQAMSRAERLLTGGDPEAALAAERAAVDSLQRAFARDRYLLRALASRSHLDLARRLTGDRAGSRDMRVPLPPTAENRRAARLRDLLQSVGDLARDAAVRRPVDRARALVLAEAALRIDPDSASLRGVAADIQRGAFDAAVDTLVVESRRALAEPPLRLPAVAAPLRRALDVALGEPR
jgi:hypothetical protein